ncbi:hypothetical protein H4219_003275 [Mycoemilia scoparia]|uniref:Uncharacterized protein n=1 Tax=Mycoemilia scoparia TaxID=417184 RepID=A0A9W8DT77_9FUNG|nr:hypothetical protein H4219_003275 [Mycoemilia scoparia]
MARKPNLLPFLTIQHDAQIDFSEVLNSNEEDSNATIWTSVYKQGMSLKKRKTPIHDTIEITPSDSGQGLSLKGSEGVELTYENKRTLTGYCKKLGIDGLRISFPKKQLKPEIGGKKGGIFIVVQILSFDVSPTEDLYVAGSGDGRLAVYDLQKDERRMDLIGHSEDVTACKFFPSGQGHTSFVTDVDIVGIGKNVISSSKDGTVRLWNCGTSSEVCVFKIGERPVNCINLGSYTTKDEHETQEKLFIAGSADGTIQIYDILGKKRAITSYSNTLQEVTAVAYLPASGLYASGTSNGAVEIWDIRSHATPLFCFQRNDSKITDLSLSKGIEGHEPTCFVATADGGFYKTSELSSENDIQVVEEFIGPDLDCITRIRSINNPDKPNIYPNIWNSCIDGTIRLY